MPAFIVDITKQHAVTLESWGNRYLVNAADLTDASSAAPIIASAEASFHFGGIEFVQARVATLTANDGVYVTIPLTNVGQMAVTGKTMPLFCTLDVVAHPSGFGRPLRKYYHTGFDDVFYDADFTYDDALLSTVFDNITQMVSDLNDNGTPWIKNTDHEVVAIAVKTRVLSHQFTKASKRNL